VIFKVFVVIKIEIEVFWVVMPCIIVVGYLFYVVVSLTLRENRLGVFENRVLMRILGPKREEVK
jgi:hypothetical protein